MSLPVSACAHYLLTLLPHPSQPQIPFVLCILLPVLGCHSVPTPVPGTFPLPVSAASVTLLDSLRAHSDMLSVFPVSPCSVHCQAAMSTFLCESSVRSPVLSTDRFSYFFLQLERTDTLERMFYCLSLDSVLMMIQDNYSDSSSTLFKQFSELD